MTTEDTKNTQGDLFNEICNENIYLKINNNNNNNNLNTINKKNLFEKFILLLLFFIIFGAIIYTIGYRRGKLAVENNSNNTQTNNKVLNDYIVIATDDYQNKIEKTIIPANNTQFTSKIVDLPANKNIEGNKKNATNIGVVKNTKKNYTVQLVTYKGKKYANNELNFLKGLGYNAFIITSGDYNIVCVEKCSTLIEAKKLLKKIMKDKAKRYPGAYTRKIKK